MEVVGGALWLFADPDRVREIINKLIGAADVNIMGSRSARRSLEEVLWSLPGAKEFTMPASFTAELLKLYKRPANWMLTVLLFVCVVIFGYFFNYQIMIGLRAQGGQGSSSQGADVLQQGLVPQGVPFTILSQAATFGGAVIIIIAALAIGSEYSRGTLKIILTQRLERPRVLAGAMSALGVLFLVLSIAMLVVGSLSSYIVAELEGVSPDWPTVGQWARALGATWLVLCTWGSLSIFLATLFRGTTVAIGLGLIYVLVIEDLLRSSQLQSEAYSSFVNALPGQNASNLIDAFAADIFAGGGPPGADPLGATLILSIYIVGFLVLSLLLFWRRDIS